MKTLVLTVLLEIFVHLSLLGMGVFVLGWTWAVIIVGLCVMVSILVGAFSKQIILKILGAKPLSGGPFDPFQKSGISVFSFGNSESHIVLLGGLFSQNLTVLMSYGFLVNCDDQNWYKVEKEIRESSKKVPFRTQTFLCLRVLPWSWVARPVDNGVSVSRLLVVSVIETLLKPWLMLSNSDVSPWSKTGSGALPFNLNLIMHRGD